MAFSLLGHAFPFGRLLERQFALLIQAAGELQTLLADPATAGAAAGRVRDLEQTARLTFRAIGRESGRGAEPRIFNQESSMSSIAFIGLGNMGGGMAANLVKAGHEVHAFDLSADALARAKEAGCATFATVEEAVAGVDAVVSMLPNGAIVRDVYEKSVFGSAPAGSLLLDCSTIDVATARAVAATAVAKGYAMVDAPVSGGIAAANGGTLTFMVGGGDADFAKAQPILAAMGKAVIHAGGSGNGQAAKICNNMLLGASMVA
ncbi:MAG TPA: NAD(P)-binding domain-containing protein, partial [Chromatiaceae bacterium]|nr:NAD(P)-binding domain-containing protein [Chromatiaceae bacterium]